MLSTLVKSLSVLAIAALWILMVTAPAEAAFCRTVAGHSICILDIKRSAKYHWEYRARVSVDGKKRPFEVYNCRRRIRVRRDGRIVPFDDDGVGNSICSLLAR
ncbi:hypothetical protein KR51_00000850 [Rubidibacter lacunae KORDI 51-2]|uniref:Uncharacterized protein n=1 Tax=Rubidibacter lacunae KORDI 51-2 TaxID=582515 RepID=U5DQT3_9CHRO|nr:hypothetical protein [Rubidibacter lacunae]ERN43192.1 hypothetical protein KR51_00000850 [Rubidibacter lacunae KORDI 51-2]